MRHPCSSQARLAQRGVATVEFAIAAPVLLLLMLSSAELGRILMQYNTLTQSLRDAARYAASNAAVGTTGLVSITGQLRTSTANLAVYGNTAGTGSPVLPGLAAGAVTVADAGGGYISVAATYTYRPMLGATLPTFGFRTAPALGVPLSAAILMRAL